MPQSSDVSPELHSVGRDGLAAVDGCGAAYSPDGPRVRVRVLPHHTFRAAPGWCDVRRSYTPRPQGDDIRRSYTPWHRVTI